MTRAARLGLLAVLGWRADAEARCATKEELPATGAPRDRCRAADVYSNTTSFAQCSLGECECCATPRPRFEPMTGEELQRRCVAAEAPHTGGLRAVFTISTGGYDVASISDVAYDDEDGIDYLLFCDGGPLGSCEQLRLRAARRWRIVEVPLTAFESCGGDALCVSRDVKLRPHLYLDPKYAKSIYVDANVRIVASPAPLFGAVGGGIDFASFEYDRGIKDEADHAYLYLRRAHRLRETKLAAKLRFRIRAQVKAYGKIPKTGYGKVLVRAHTTRTCKFSEVWWHEFANGVPRDQLSLLWAAGAAKRHGFVRASLNLGPGPRKCTCAADDVNFQAFFQHMGNSRKQGARKTAPGA